MDSYNLFGDDGSGMLEGLTDLGGADGFSSGSSTAVAGENKDSAENSYRQQYNQGSVTQEGSIQKLPPFTGSTGGSITGSSQSGAAGSAAGSEYHEYTGYGPRPRVPQQPPHGAVHPPHHMHPSHQYPGYHPGPDPMYAMSEHQAGMSEMGGWAGAAAGNRYAAMTPAYRHPQYEHTQKMHQYQQQGSNIALQGQSAPYLPRQPHFSQPPSQQVYGQQNYTNYGGMHGAAPRMAQHAYHQQLEPHQYHPNMPQHQAMPQHQPMPNINQGIQGHGNVHGLHHAGGVSATGMHHVPRQQAPAPQMYPPHAMPYPHQPQHPLDVNVAPQYKPDGASPQYRPPFPQLSPQMSPRAQHSPRPQLSPRPVLSPSKASPHRAPQPQPQPFAPNTLQALEQMVLPAGAEYPYQRNPASPVVPHVPPQQWPPNKIPQQMNPMPVPDTVDPAKLAAESAAPAPPKSVDPGKNIPSVEANNLDKPLLANDRPPDMPHQFAPPVNVNSMKDQMRGSPLPPHSAAPSINMASSISDNLDKSKLENLASENNTDKVQKPKDENLNENVANPANEMQQTPSRESMEKEQIVGQGIIAPSSNTMTNIGTPLSIEHAQSPSQMHLPSSLSQPTSINAPNSNQPYMNSVSRSQTYQGAMAPSNSLPNVPPNMQTLMPQTVPNSMPPNVTANLGNVSNNMALQLNANGQTNVQPNHAMPHMNINNTMSPIPPGHTAQNVANISTAMQANTGTNIPSNIANAQGGAMPNVPNSLPNVPPNAVPTAPNVVPMPAQNMHPNMPPTGPNSQGNIPNMPPSMNPNIMVIGSNTMSQPNMPIMYPASHPQERASLQQQIQEIYCLPPSNENQEKVRCLQERLVLLQQHEANDKCNGGPNCILQNPVYGSKMVESPQVTSTTGRGRKGPAKPRKPRAKKEKVPPATQPLDQLPVSEDCVTAGTGIQNNSELDMELGEDMTILDCSTISVDESKGGKVRKPRGPRKTKERKPRTPKVKPVLEPGEIPVKVRRKRQPRDPNAPPRKRRSKKDAAEIIADTTTSHELDKSSLDKSVNETLDKTDETNFDESTVTDFDDIPVSKIAIKDLLEEAESKRGLNENDDDADYIDDTPKRRGKKRGSGGGRRAAGGRRAGSSGRGRGKRRGTIVPESDGEPDDLVTTPPPSPPQEDDSSKRRSARNTKRKKYTDDVMIRLSDDEFQGAVAAKQDDSKLDDLNDTKEGVKFDGTPKPNFMYVNTLEEDSMIVQYVLACRMSKREIKPEPPPPPEAPKNETIEDNSTEVKEKVSPEEKDAEAAIRNIKEDKDSEEIIPEPKTSEGEEPDKNDDEQAMYETDEVKTENDKSVKPEGSQSYEDKEPLKPIIVDIEEYYVKYRNFSYLHCEWKTEEELYKGDKRIFSKIKRFKQKQQQMNIFELLDEEPFNPDYIEVERILDVSETQDPGSETAAKHYLVKWKSLQYEDSTWELEEDIDVDKIRQYRMFNEIPPKETWKYKRRPPPDQWVQLKESPLYKGGNTLRPYQLEGLNWLLFSWHNNRNCILADEMGLGKTIQSLTFVNSVWEYGIRGPFLIIAPLSTIPNWQREFEAWTDMNVIVYHGSQQSKSMIQEYEFYLKNEKHEPIKEITKFNVLITTFEIIVTDFQELKSFNWRICVIDEAHRLKNRNCKLLEGLRQLNLEHRVLLSGTPLQNNVNELFSLLNFLEPTQFSSSEAFLNDFGQLQTEDEVIKLQALLKPMMLRRLKEDVEKSLAPKEETIIEVELTNIQKKYYRAILERNFSFLQKGTASAANIPNLMNTMMELRKCCIHPYLLNGAEDQIQYDYKQQYGEDKQAYYKALIQSSGKMVLVDKLLPKLKAGGHRVLIFSQMVKCLDILEDYLMYKKYPFERIDGRIRGNLRQEAIDRFSKPDSDRFVFLLCTKAGGLGINLTAADTVIIYDSDWNPQNDLQAQARCHRIGQQKMVKIYRLVCRNSYEREMFDKASLKLGLDKAILQSMNTSQGEKAGPKQLSKKEIEDLLKKGAYGAVMDEDNAGDKFCEEDIEMILARRTQVIQMESEKGSTFSKASFAATDQRSDIDIRDPDFWNKWAKKAEIDTTEKKEDEDLIVTEPRRRTMIKRYGHDDGNVEMSDEGTPDSEEDEEGISLRSRRKKDKLGRKGKRASDDYIPRHEGVPMDEEVVYGSWTRSECFKIERGLLTFGWARWDEILDKNQFRGGWTIPVIEDCARIIILFCLRHYKGDEKIRNFIWDLIEPCENGEVTISRNHSGLHNPVPRGRNAKKKNKVRDVPKANDNKWEDPNHWCSQEKYDCEAYLESSYKKHLFRHANKVLLRVRMMYYIKHEVIGDFAAQIENGAHASSLGMRVPRGVDSAPPRLWWDSECDVSLLVGTYVHGYENYLAMRSDPRLAFVDKLGPPDDAECTDIKSEERKTASGGGDEECTDDVSSGAGATSPAASPRASPRPHDDDNDGGGQWPSMQDLNTRLRRLITAYQRNYKREELKMQQKAKMERRERMEQLARDEAAQWRWTRADEEAFRRTVASYGVEFDPATKSLRWNRFRALARLDNKSDDALTDYLKAFMAMCKRQCGLSVGEAELPTRADLKAESIGEERAIATLERIDLLRVLREEVVPHALLEARLALCERDGAPPWWVPAAHDKLLVAAVCKHGLGDTYHKIFCDPKLPFAECAMKYYSKNKKSSAKSETRKGSDDEGEKETTSERTLRSRKRTSNIDRDEDTDALSELENLAKLGRIEETVSPDYWFTERALETRLHHIAHAVQNCEWPGGADSKRSESDDRRGSKRHIAIDVETERAKLHALLASPAHQHAHAASSSTRDDASSDSGSRRSTPAPAPPPAHQRVSASPAPAAVDLSAPLDLSEAQDFSTHRRTPQTPHTPQPAHHAQPASRLDDTLTKIMKRNNVPPPESIAGKEKKRKKLDEIVLGLSAAKRAPPTAPPPAASPRTPVLPDVTVTPAVSSTPSSTPTQKPFSVTVSNVSAPHKELSSFLQQSLEQKPRSSPSSSALSAQSKYSHEAKVNKWLAEQRRGSGSVSSTPRLAPDEPVPVVHRVSGKRLDGARAPQLKHLAQWITENPMYDIDPKWTESIKEHVKLPQDARSPRPQSSQSGQQEPRKKGRPPTLDSASSSAHLSQGMAQLNPALLASLSAFDPKTLAATLSSLSGFDPKLLGSIDPKLLASLDPKLLSSFDPKLLSSFDPKLLSSFDPKLMSSFDPKMLASLSSFDSKNNPLLGSFGGMPNLLGNLSGGNLFANLAGLGLPGFPGLDMSSLGGAGSSADKSKSRKSNESGSGSSSKGSSQFPFVFPNPNMLYPQLGMGGLGAFGMPGSLGSAYDALGLLGSMPQASRSSKSSTASSTSRAPAATVTSAGASRSSSQQKSSASHLSQMMPNPYLLESLAKQTNYEALLKSDKRLREGDTSEDLSKDKSKTSASHVSAEFAAIQEKLLKGDKKDIDISKMLLEQMASGALSASLVSADSKRPRDDRDPYDFSKASADYATARAMTSDPVALTHKRSHDEMAGEPQNLSVSSEMHPPKKLKETGSSESSAKVDVTRDHSHSHSADMDLEDLIAPSTVIKTGMKTSDFDPNVPRRTPTQSPAPVTQHPPQDKLQPRRSFDESHPNGNDNDPTSEHSNGGSEIKDPNADDEIAGPQDMSADAANKAAKRKPRKSTEENPAAGPRRELRSSAPRHPE